MAFTIDELREKAATAAKELAEAEAAHAARPPLSVEHVIAKYEDAMARHDAADNDEDRHDIASAALKYLEHNKVTGPIIDRLAQLVVNARGE